MISLIYLYFLEKNIIIFIFKSKIARNNVFFEFIQLMYFIKIYNKNF
jgi:hypothetical protein